jgi:hypothetical protein
MTDWLLEGPAWVRYRTRRDLLGQGEDDPQISGERATMVTDLQVTALIAELADWPGPVVKSHKNAAHPLHKLAFLADIGLKSSDPGMDAVIERILSGISPEGVFTVCVNVPKHFGGDGQDHDAWFLCDAPLVAYALLRFGLGADGRVQNALDFLAEMVRSNGWPCAASPALGGKFRGPGRKDDPCPYATLIMTRALLATPDGTNDKGARTGAETLLNLWANSHERRPYLFKMGTDFRKLKAPMVWYDILHVFDVVSRFPHLQDDPRLTEMADVIRSKADPEGRFTPESIWTAWKGWDFGQKREPSRGLTLLARRALARVGG